MVAFNEPHPASATMEWKDVFRQRLRQRDESQKQLMGVFSAVSDMFSVVTHLKQDLKHCQEENSELQLEIRDLKTTSPSKDGASKREVVRLEKRVAELSQQLSDKSQALLQLTQEKCELMQERTEKAHQNIEVYERLMKAEAELEGKTKSLKELQAEKEQLQQDNKRLQADLHHKKIELQTCVDELMALQMEYNITDNELREVKAERDELVGRVLLMKQQEADTLNSLNAFSDRRKAQELEAELADILRSGPDLEPEMTNGAPVCTRAQLPTKAVFSFDAHDGDVYDCKFDVMGTKVATSGTDKKIKLWACSGASLAQTFTGHSSGVACIAFDQADEFLVSGSYDKTLMLWDLKSGRSMHKMTGHTDKIFNVRFSTDSKRVYSCSQDRTIKVWSTRRGVLERSLFPTSTCLDLELDASDSLITCHFDKTVRLWDARGGTDPAHTIHTDHTHPITSLARHPDGSVVITSGKDSMLKAVDIRSLEVVRTFTHDDYHVSVFGCKVATSPDGRYIITGDDRGRLFVFNYRTGTLEKKLSNENTSAITACAWSPAGDMVCSVSKDKQATLWACVS